MNRDGAKYGHHPQSAAISGKGWTSRAQLIQAAQSRRNRRLTADGALSGPVHLVDLRVKLGRISPDAHAVLRYKKKAVARLDVESPVPGIHVPDHAVDTVLHRRVGVRDNLLAD